MSKQRKSDSGQSQRLTVVFEAGRNAAKEGRSRAPVLDPTVNSTLKELGEIPHEDYCALLRAFAEGYQAFCDLEAEAAFDAGTHELDQSSKQS